jgi:hypothetical protein
MKSTILSIIILVSAAFSIPSFGQATVLVPGKTIERKILKGEDQLYSITVFRYFIDGRTYGIYH